MERSANNTFVWIALKTASGAEMRAVCDCIEAKIEIKTPYGPRPSILMRWSQDYFLVQGNSIPILIGSSFFQTSYEEHQHGSFLKTKTFLCPMSWPENFFWSMIGWWIFFYTLISIVSRLLILMNYEKISNHCSLFKITPVCYLTLCTISAVEWLV